MVCFKIKLFRLTALRDKINKAFFVLIHFFILLQIGQEVVSAKNLYRTYLGQKNLWKMMGSHAVSSV